MTYNFRAAHSQSKHAPTVAPHQDSRIPCRRQALVLAMFATITASSLHAQQNRPVSLSINNSARVAIQPNAGGVGGESIAYFAGDSASQSNRRLWQMRLADPVLCADFVASQSASEVRFRLIDSNGLIQGSDPRGFRGLSPYVSASDTGGIRFRLDSLDNARRVLDISTSSALRCFVFPAGVSAARQPETASRQVRGGDFIFADGFETLVTGPMDLVTTFVNVPTGVRGGDTASYTIRVQNAGAVAANNVQVRDYFPKPVSGSAQPGLSDGTWTCSGSGGATCSQASGNGYIFQSAASIPGAGRLEFAVTRQLSNTTPPTTGATFRVQAAAFSAPADNEATLNNNPVSSNVITVVTNVAPTVSGISTQAISEDAQTGAVGFTVSDPDGPSAPVVTAISSNTSVVASNGISLGGSGSNRTITITPVADAFGSATITINASDSVSSGSTSFVVDVSPVNDRPTFNAPAAINWPSGTTGVKTVSNLVPGLSFGPSEAGQTLQAVQVRVISGGGIFGPGFEPDSGNVQVSGSLASVSYGLNGTSGTATIGVIAIDNGGGACGGSNDACDTSTERTFTISVAAVPPNISNVADQNFFEDNNGAGPLTISGLSFTVGPVGVVNCNNVSASSGATSILPNAAFSVSGGTGTSCVLSINVPQHAFNALDDTTGTPTNVTLMVSNGPATATDNIAVRLKAVNDLPSLTVLASRNVNTPTGGANLTTANWISSASVGPANEAAPPAGSGVAAQTINFRNVSIFAQTASPVIQNTASSPAIGLDGTTLQVRWVAGTVPTGAVCLAATVTDSEGEESAPRGGVISANGGTIGCAP